MSAADEFDEWREDDFGLCLKLGGELLEQEEDNTGTAEGKREGGALEERERFIKERLAHRLVKEAEKGSLSTNADVDI